MKVQDRMQARAPEIPQHEWRKDPPKPERVEISIVRDRWEYRSALMDREADLSQYGTEGWELVDVIGQPADMAVFYFKRRR